jgi:hypothetical protein
VAGRQVREPLDFGVEALADFDDGGFSSVHRGNIEMSQADAKSFSLRRLAAFFSLRDRPQPPKPRAPVQPANTLSQWPSASRSTAG